MFALLLLVLMMMPNVISGKKKSGKKNEQFVELSNSSQSPFIFSEGASTSNAELKHPYPALMSHYGVPYNNQSFCTLHDCIRQLNKFSSENGPINYTPSFLLDGNKIVFDASKKSSFEKLVEISERYPSLIIGYNETKMTLTEKCYNNLYFCFDLMAPDFLETPTLHQVMSDFIPQINSVGFDSRVKIPEYTIDGKMIHVLTESSLGSSKTADDLLDLLYDIEGYGPMYLVDGRKKKKTPTEGGSSKSTLTTQSEGAETVFPDPVEPLLVSEAIEENPGELNNIFDAYPFFSEELLLKLLGFYPHFWDHRYNHFTDKLIRISRKNVVSSELRIKKLEKIAEFYKIYDTISYNSLQSILKRQKMTLQKLSDLKGVPNVNSAYRSSDSRESDMEESNLSAIKGSQIETSVYRAGKFNHEHMVLPSKDVDESDFLRNISKLNKLMAPKSEVVELDVKISKGLLKEQKAEEAIETKSVSSEIVPGVRLSSITTLLNKDILDSYRGYKVPTKPDLKLKGPMVQETVPKSTSTASVKQDVLKLANPLHAFLPPGLLNQSGDVKDLNEAMFISAAIESLKITKEKIDESSSSVDPPGFSSDHTLNENVIGRPESAFQSYSMFLGASSAYSSAQESPEKASTPSDVSANVSETYKTDEGVQSPALPTNEQEAAKKDQGVFTVSAYEFDEPENEPKDVADEPEGHADPDEELEDDERLDIPSKYCSKPKKSQNDDDDEFDPEGKQNAPKANRVSFILDQETSNVNEEDLGNSENPDGSGRQADLNDDFQETEGSSTINDRYIENLYSGGNYDSDAEDCLDDSEFRGPPLRDDINYDDTSDEEDEKPETKSDLKGPEKVSNKPLIKRSETVVGLQSEPKNVIRSPEIPQVLSMPSLSNPLLFNEVKKKSDLSKFFLSDGVYDPSYYVDIEKEEKQHDEILKRKRKVKDLPVFGIKDDGKNPDGSHRDLLMNTSGPTICDVTQKIKKDSGVPDRAPTLTARRIEKIVTDLCKDAPKPKRSLSSGSVKSFRSDGRGNRHNKVLKKITNVEDGVKMFHLTDNCSVTELTYWSIEKREKLYKPFTFCKVQSYPDVLYKILSPLKVNCEGFNEQKDQGTIVEYLDNIFQEQRLAEFGVLHMKNIMCTSCGLIADLCEYKSHRDTSIPTAEILELTCPVCLERTGKRTSHRITHRFSHSEFTFFVNSKNFKNVLGEKSIQRPVSGFGKILGSINFLSTKDPSDDKKSIPVYTEGFGNFLVVSRTAGNLPRVFFESVMSGRSLKNIANELDYSIDPSTYEA